MTVSHDALAEALAQLEAWVNTDALVYTTPTELKADIRVVLAALRAGSGEASPELVARHEALEALSRAERELAVYSTTAESADFHHERGELFTAVAQDLREVERREREAVMEGERRIDVLEREIARLNQGDDMRDALTYIAEGSPWKDKLSADSIVLEYEEVAKAALRAGSGDSEPNGRTVSDSPPARDALAEAHDYRDPLVWLGARSHVCTDCGKTRNDPAHIGYEPERDKDGWPKRWSDPTYLGDGPWGA